MVGLLLNANRDLTSKLNVMRRKLLSLLTVVICSHSAWSQCTTISSYPYLEDFDSSPWAVPFTLDPCWTPNPVPTGAAWGWHLYSISSNSANRPNTGVFGDVDGTGNYLFAYSDPAGTAGQTCNIISPSFDLTSLSNPALEFAYHMYGTNMGKLRIEVKSASGSWTAVDSLVGQQHNLPTDPWSFMTINLSAFSSSNTQVRFVGFYGAQSAGDINLDEFKIYNDSSSACGAPASFQLVGSPTTEATFTWTQKSLDSCEIIYGAAGFSPTAGGTSQIGYGDSITISGLIQLSAYDAYVRHYCNGDTSVLVGPVTFNTQCGVVTAPYYTDFTVSEYGRASQIPSGGFGWNNCWTQASLTNQSYWAVDTSGGPLSVSPTTGPDFDNTNFPNPGGAFMVLKSSGSVVADIAYSPLVDISTLQDPALTFAYHMYGADVATLRLDVWDGSSWTNGVWVLSGEQQISGSDPWNVARLSLANFAGADTIQIRFHASGSTSGVNSDIAIDDLTIDEESACAPVANVTVTTIGLSNFEFDASASVNAQSVDWDFGDGNTATGTIVTHTYTTNGTYSVSCIVTNGCGVDTLTQTVVALSSNEFATLSKLRVYPNPANQYVIIELNSSISQSTLVELLSINGRVVLRSSEALSPGDNSLELDLGELPAGLYHLRMQMDGGLINAPVIIE